MLNEIFFGLLGITGGVFIESDNQFAVSNTIDFISDSEKQVLEKIGLIGFNFKILKNFCKNYNDLNSQNIFSQEETTVTISVFMAPLVRSIETQLREYEEAVLNLERKYKKTMLLTSGEILYELTPYLNKFEKTYEILEHICNNNVKGGEILNYLFDKTIHGDPSLRNVFIKNFFSVNYMLVSYITEWIINGEIPDNQEFFIQSANVLVQNDVNPLSVFQENSMESWSSTYYINYQNLPKYFPSKLAENILFLGKAIKILNSSKNSEEDRLSYFDLVSFYEKLKSLPDRIFIGDKTSSLINFEIFEDTITEIKTYIGRILFSLVIEKRDFAKHFKAVKNMFVTYNDEFFHNFIIKIKHLMNLPFDAKIEEEINQNYFKTSLKDIFKIDEKEENHEIYKKFKIKLISSGFNVKFDSKSIKTLVDKKEIHFIGGINYDSYSNKLRFINTMYKENAGCFWSLQTLDIEEEFLMGFSFSLKNFSKNMKENDNFVSPQKFVSTNEKLKSSLVKSKLKKENTQKSIKFNFVFNLSKNETNFTFLNELDHYFNFVFEFVYENVYSFPKRFIVSLNYINKHRNNNFDNYKRINEHEICIFNEEIQKNLDFLRNDKQNQFFINFKNNQIEIYEETRLFYVSSPFNLNYFLSKDKRKMNMGFVINSENMDIIVDLHQWSLNVLSGEVYHENSNLMLINYQPPWPHNFIFNENILKMYNLIFNLVFPLKSNLILVNQLWIEKKNIGKKFNEKYSIFKEIDIFNSEIVFLLQNLISFFMFDVIQLNFQNFEKYLRDSTDFEEIIKKHEEMLGEVIANSFIKSKKIMSSIFEILFVIRKFINYVEKILIEYTEMDDPEDYYTQIRELRKEYELKIDNLRNHLSKIKNSKYFSIISQLLSKIEYQ